VVDPDPEQLAVMFKALGHAARLRIFARLASRCTPGAVTQADCFRACVGDIASDLGIAPSTVSHHMKELREAGLIRMERQGKAIECWAEPDVVALVGNLERRLLELGRR
jgi:ArsR family transcriptional regulator, arsenate/arsenite/antimonite-responsive transcriptional repressor